MTTKAIKPLVISQTTARRALAMDLPPLVDASLVEVERAVAADVGNALSKRDTRLANLAAALARAEARIAELELALKASTKDDKYALTKAKMVRLMRELGYTD